VLVASGIGLAVIVLAALGVAFSLAGRKAVVADSTDSAATTSGAGTSKSTTTPEAPSVPAVPPGDYALEFQPQNEVIVAASLLDPNLPYTIELLVRTSQPSYDAVAYLARAGDYAALIFTGDGQGLCWQFRGPLGDVQSTKAPVEADGVIHVAGVRDRSEMRFYVDGKVISKTACPSKPLPGLILEPFIIGGGAFNGLIDEIRLSQVARYNIDFKPKTRFTPDAATVALYHLDNGQGVVLEDATGSERHGKIEGATWILPEKSAAGEKN